MTYDEIEAALRHLTKEIRAGVYDGRDLVLVDDLLELADQLNLTAHPVQVIRPRKKRR